MVSGTEGFSGESAIPCCKVKTSLSWRANAGSSFQRVDLFSGISIYIDIDHTLILYIQCVYIYMLYIIYIIYKYIYIYLNISIYIIAIHISNPRTVTHQRKVLKFLRQSFGGGTYLEDALAEAAKKLEQPTWQNAVPWRHGFWSMGREFVDKGYAI